MFLKHLLKKILILLAIFSGSCFSNEISDKSFSDITIIVSSCDKYSNLWKPFFELLFKKWEGLRESNVDIILISNKKNYKDERITAFTIPNEKSWSDNMISVLEKVKTKYVLVLLEDYFMTDFNKQRFIETYEFMKDSKAGYMQLSEDGKCPLNPIELFKGIRKKDTHEQYRTSLQAAIWQTDVFKHLLKSGENAWAVEIEGSTRSEGCMAPFLAIYKDHPMNYLNMTQDGYLNSDRVEEAKKLGVEIDTNGIKVDKDYKLKLWYKRTFKHYVYWNIYRPLADGIDKLLRTIL